MPDSPSRNEFETLPALADIDQQGHSGSSTGQDVSSSSKMKDLPALVLSLDDPCSRPQRRFFLSNENSLSRARNFNVSGRAEGPRFRHAPGMAANIPDKTAAFKLIANFSDYRAGNYNIHWRVRALEDFNIPNGLHFLVYVTYDYISVRNPFRIGEIAKDQWYNLILEEQLVILPHEGKANVQVLLCNNDNTSRDVYSGFEIEHVEIRPFTMRAEPQSGVRNNLVRRAGIPNFVFDTAKLRPTALDTSYIPSVAPITRIASSKNSRFVATLALAQDEANITVWDMAVLKNPSIAPKKVSKLYRTGVSATVPFAGIGKLAIGLSISTTGDQLAIYQEPKIGEWLDGSDVGKATFPFKLFNNPMVRQQTLIVNIDTPAENIIDGKSQSAAQDGSPNERFLSYNAGDTPGSSTSISMQLQEVAWEHELLRSFIGFGEFLPENKQGKWKKNEVNSTLTSSEGGDETDGGDDAKDVRAKSNEPMGNSVFVACNGLYLDVYEISPQQKWKRLHTITLSDLLPTLSRRITCKMMMESISSNTFMWLEDGGRSCTIWNLLTGSNITHISSIENARFKGATFRGHSKMAISPHESIVALASVDGSLTTYFVNTGMAIDDRKFIGEKIEYVGFCSQDDQLFVILRDSTSYQLRALILDTLQLKSETEANQVPIPTIGTTTFSFFNTRGFWNRGIVCETDGTKVNCYIAHQPPSSKVVKNSETVLKAQPQDLIYESLIDDDIQYKLMTAVHKALLPEGEGKAYWVNRVEVIQHDLVQRSQKIIFSFVPEPWMRAITEDFAHPEDLMSAYFVPCGTRFAVVGVQTVQIWNLPTFENPKCSLQFIWSQPKDENDADFDPHGLYHRSPRVRDYYMDTLSTSIYIDTESGNTVAEIKMNDKARKKVVCIPGPGTIGARFAILYCFRSIHLLAAAFTYSKNESKKAGVTLTLEDHAEALVRFTREHINRMMSIGVYSPLKRGGYSQVAPSAPHQRPSPICAPMAPGETFRIHGNANRRYVDDDDRPHLLSEHTRMESGKPSPKTVTKPAPRPDIVTVLTLLLDHPYFQKANHIFVEGLLNSANGDWIPRDNKALNPIKRAIEARNGQLVEAFIEYCIKNAKKYHPAYLMPAVQCLNELSDRYPTILANMFRRASYVPAHNHGYVASHAIIANPQYSAWLMQKLMLWKWFTGKGFEKSGNINDYAKPVFSLRSQLPFRASSLLHILSIETSVRDKRIEKFPVKIDSADEEKKLQSPYSHKIYVAPFPKLSMYGPYRPWFKHLQSAKSAFTDIAGREFFDSPAMVATLEFKWHKFGLRYWLSRFLCVFVFFILVLVITGMQIKSADVEGKQFGTDEFNAEIMGRYLFDWRPVFETTIVIGFVLVGYEVMQFIDSPRKYISSPYNYMDLAAYAMPIVGCFMFLEMNPVPGPSGHDEGPDQIWVMSFAILALYMNILFELRVIKQLGIVVNIILNITRTIVWFFLIFGLFLVGFTHALLHLLHTKKIPEAGRYDPVNTTFENGAVSFHIMMVIFFFFTAILLLNILIALMNDAFNESKDLGQLAWLKQWSEVIAEVEIFLMSQSTRQNRNYFPDYIYYGASEQDAELYESQYNISNKSNLSIESRFLIDTVSSEQITTQTAQREVLRDVQYLSKELMHLKSTQERITQDIGSLAELMAAYLAQTTTPIPAAGPSGDESPPTSQGSPVEQDPPASASTPKSEGDGEPLASPICSGSLPSPPPPPPPSMAVPKPPFSKPTRVSDAPTASAPPPPSSTTAPKLPPLVNPKPSGFSSVPAQVISRPGMKPSGLHHRISDATQESDSPSTYCSPIVHFDTPASGSSSTPQSVPLPSGRLPNQAPAGIPHYPESRSSTSPAPSSSADIPSHHKITDLSEDERIVKPKTSHSTLKDRLRQKLTAAHTVDDILRPHRRQENYTASNPVYMSPPSPGKVIGQDSDDDEADDGGDNEDDNGGNGAYEDYRESSSSARRRTPVTRQQSMVRLRYLQQRALAPIRRTQSEALLTESEHEPVLMHERPSPPSLHESSSTSES
ncbi:hypothetical protein BGX28_007164 [Mortierella sp. GBA30]|nr:hypothetical protein BGX28_007164 [Mortierella sp. GBA30]